MMFGGFGPGRGFGYGMNYFGGYGFMWMIGFVFLIVVLMFLFRGRGRRFMRHHGYHHNHPYHEYYGDSTPPKNADQEALEILKSRYAKGEITEEEYKRMKEVLIND